MERFADRASKYLALMLDDDAFHESDRRFVIEGESV